MNISVNTISAGILGNFFKTLGKKRFNMSKKMAKNIIKNPGRALDITANVTTAAASRNLENVLSTPPEVVNFFHTGKGL